MPNWCYNQLTITGKKENIAMIVNKVSLMNLNEEDVIPEGTKAEYVFETLIGRGDISNKEYDNGGWYNHNIGRFGTKWDITKEDWTSNQFIDVDEDNGDAEVSVSFNTAWSPPTAFVLEMTRMYEVTCEMFSEESGNDFYVRILFSEGEIMEEESYPYSEGIYVFNKEGFFDWRVTEEFDWVHDEYGTNMEEVKNHFEETFGFCTEEEIEDILKDYVKYVKQLEVQTTEQ